MHFPNEGAKVRAGSRWLRWALLGAMVVCTVAGNAADDFLAPEVAFKFDVKVVDDRTVDVTYTIAPGYYMYRDKITIDGGTAVLAAPVLPPGHTKFDETFNKTVETYRDSVRVPVVVQQSAPRFRLTVIGQGCADKGLCYPPQQSTADISLLAQGGDGTASVVDSRSTLASGFAKPPAAESVPSAHSDTPDAAAGSAGGLDGLLRAGHFWSILAAFFAAGVLLSLTPCVLPMLPILSSIIVGGQSGRASRWRGLTLATAYALGMALVYTAFGVAAGLAGEGLAASLQNPWVLGAFGVLLTVLAVSMFGGFELRPPAAFTSRLASASNRLPAGRLAGVFAMGGVSALIVSPCVAAPLAASLIYLSQTRDVLLGGTALFAMAAGMSVPLLLLGASAGAWLPRAGAWMDDVKRFFGLVLLAVAVWTIEPIVPGPVLLVAWGALLLAAALLLAGPTMAADRPGFQPGPYVRRVVAVVAAVFGLLQLVGAASGGTDPLQPLARWSGAGTSAPASVPVSAEFRVIHSAAELDAQLGAGRPVMLDFYAEWCKSCKEMDRTTYADPQVRKTLSRALLLKADVTANTEPERALLKRFNLFGPPGTIFFDTNGREVAQTRVIGYQDAATFLETLARAGL